MAAFIVKLDMRDENKIETRVKAYNKEELDKAEQDYISTEKEFFGDSRRQVLKLGVNKVENLQPAYPAYFLDAETFVITIQGIIR